MNRIIAALALTATGCGGGNADVDSGRADASSDTSPVHADGGQCLSPGRGTAHVTLELAPGVQVDRLDVWIAAMCVLPDGSEYAVRVVRAESSGAASVLDGLGAGTYVFRASALVLPGAASPHVDLTDGTTFTTLTLVPGPRPLATLHAAALSPADSGMDVPTLDASAADVTSAHDGTTLADAFDAADALAMNDADAMESTPTFDGGIDTGFDAGRDGTVRDDGIMPPGVRFTVPILRPGANVVIGTLEAYVQDHGDPQRPAIDVQLVTRASDCGDGCQHTMLLGAELRTSMIGQPEGMGAALFQPMLLAPGTSAVSSRQTLPGLFDSTDTALTVALFGSYGDVRDGGTDASSPTRPDI